MLGALIWLSALTLIVIMFIIILIILSCLQCDRRRQLHLQINTINVRILSSIASYNALYRDCVITFQVGVCLCVQYTVQ